MSADFSPLAGSLHTIVSGFCANRMTQFVKLWPRFERINSAPGPGFLVTEYPVCLLASKSMRLVPYTWLQRDCWVRGRHQASSGCISHSNGLTHACTTNDHVLLAGNNEITAAFWSSSEIKIQQLINFKMHLLVPSV